MRKLIATASLAAFVIVSSCSGDAGSRPESPSATSRAGEMVVIGPEVGKVTLVHFWATWCGPCRHELPSFVEFAKANEGQKLRWVAVANDPSFQEVDDHLRKAGITMDTLLDPRGAALQGWRVQAIPTTIVLDERGTEIARYIGARNWNDPRQQREVLAFAR